LTDLGVKREIRSAVSAGRWGFSRLVSRKTQKVEKSVTLEINVHHVFNVNKEILFVELFRRSFPSIATHVIGPKPLFADRFDLFHTSSTLLDQH
jgi:hypothetical protein